MTYRLSTLLLLATGLCVVLAAVRYECMHSVVTNGSFQISVTLKNQSFSPDTVVTYITLEEGQLADALKGAGAQPLEQHEIVDGSASIRIETTLSVSPILRRTLKYTESNSAIMFLMHDTDGGRRFVVEKNLQRAKRQGIPLDLQEVEEVLPGLAG